MTGIRSTAGRVQEHTPDYINERIRRRIDQAIEYHGRHPEFIDQRLKELDEEWDIERTLQMNAATFILSGLVLSMIASRKWFIIPLAVAGFLLQHSLRGWCPPVKILRKCGVRTRDEILREKTALLALKGRFDDINSKKSSTLEEKIGAVLKAV
jgi:hypothetical protein